MSRAHKSFVTVRFGDTDPYGIVYFVSYFRYMHRAIEEFLRAADMPPDTVFKNREEGFGLPIVSAKADFRVPAKYGDSFEVRTSVKRYGKKSVTFDFTFHTPGEEPVLADGEATIVAIGSDWRPIELPPRVRNSLKNLEARLAEG